MPKFQTSKLTRREIKKNESMVRGRQERGKKYPENIPPNELIISDYKTLNQKQDILNLINNKEKNPKSAEANNKTIFYIEEPRKAVSIGKQLVRAFKGSAVKIKWSKVDKEVKVYVDFSNLK